MPGHKGARKGSRRKGTSSRVVAPAGVISAIPKPPGHSLIDYSKFNNIGDSSDDEEYGMPRGCCCEKCRSGWPVDDPDDDPDEEEDAELIEYDPDTNSVAPVKCNSSAHAAKAKSSSSGFSFSKALGDAAKKQVAEGKVGRNAGLQASGSHISSHSGKLGLTKSVTPAKQHTQALSTDTAMGRLFALQNKIISAYLDLKGHGHRVTAVLHELNDYRKYNTVDETPDEAVLRIFAGLKIPIELADIPSLPVSLPVVSSPPKSKVHRESRTEKLPGPDWKQNRPEGVFTVQELFEGTGLFDAPDRKDPKKVATKAKPVPVKAAAAKAASGSATTSSAKQSKVAASTSEGQPVNRSKQLHEHARKEDVHISSDGDDMPLLFNDASDDEFDEDDDDDSVENFDCTFTPLSRPAQRSASQPSAPQPKPKSTATPAANKAPVPAQSKQTSEPLFREESRGPLASLYQATAVSVAKAAAETKAGSFMKGAFDKPKAAVPKASKSEAGTKSSSQGFKGMFAAPPKGKVVADEDTGHEQASKSKGETAEVVGVPGSKTDKDFMYPGFQRHQPERAAQNVKSTVSQQQKAQESAELKAARMAEELLAEEEKEKAEAADKARKEKQKNKKARRKAKKETHKVDPLPRHALNGRAQVDEVSDEDDEEDYPMDNRFAYLSGSGVPYPSHIQEPSPFLDDIPEVSTLKNPPPARAPPAEAPPADEVAEASLQKQLGGAYSLLQSVGKSAQKEVYAAGSTRAQAAGQDPEDHLQRARKVFAERRRQAEEKAAATAKTAASASSGFEAVANGSASANGLAHGKSAHTAVPGQHVNGHQTSGQGLGTSSALRPEEVEEDVLGSLLQAVTELGTAMKAGERGRLEDAIRHGTAILYKASAAPDTASVAAALRMLLRDAKPRLKQLTSRPASAATASRDKPVAVQQAAKPPHGGPPAHPTRSLSPASSTSSSFSSQQLQAQAAFGQQTHQQRPQQQPQMYQQRQAHQQPQQQQQVHQGHQQQQIQQQQIQQQPQMPQQQHLQQAHQQACQPQQMKFRRGPEVAHGGPQLPRYGAGHAENHPSHAQAQFAAMNNHHQPPAGSSAGDPGLQRMHEPAATQGYQIGGSIRPPPPPPPRFAGPPANAGPSSHQPGRPVQGNNRQGLSNHSGYMQQPPATPAAAHVRVQQHQHAATPQQQQQLMPESARAALPAHLQQALFNTAAKRQSPVKQPVLMKTYPDEGAQYVRPMPFGSTHKPQDDPDDDTDCVVCMDNVKNTVFVPCGHCLCCTACAEVVLRKNGTCPVCSTYIDSYCGTQLE